MKIRIVKPVGRFLELWDKLAKIAPNACFWASPIWVSAIADAYNWRTFLFVSEVKNSPIILPSVRTKSTLIFGTYDSLPFGYGAVLSHEPIDETVMNELVESISKLPIASIIINLPPNHPVPKSTYLSNIYIRYTHVLNLDIEKEKIMNRFSSSCRWRIRRALRAGIKVKNVDTTSGIEILKKIYKGWLKIKQPENIYKDKLFDNIAKFPNSASQIYIAEHKGEEIACMLNFLWGNEVYNFITVDVRNRGIGGAVNLLYFHALNDSLERGKARFIFGESLGIKSLEKFKESFGAKKVPVYSVKVEGKGYKRAKMLIKF